MLPIMKVSGDPLKHINSTIDSPIPENIQKIYTFRDQIITGDALRILTTFPDNTVHLAITSPPYNLGKNYDSHKDELEYKKYLRWLDNVWKETSRVLIKGGRLALNIAPTGIKNFIPIHHDCASQLRRLGMKFKAEIIWYKQTMRKRTAWGSFRNPSNPHIIPSWEYILVFSKGDRRLEGDTSCIDITKDEFMKFSDGFWKISAKISKNGHPAPFPEELIYRLIKFYSYRDNIILDMFGGTGTVATVAKKTGRHFIHIDISAKYNQIARRRVEKVK